MSHGTVSSKSVSSKSTASLLQEVRRRISPARILDTVQRLVAAPSPTGNAGPAADTLAEILKERGFDVARPIADHPASPAVVTRSRGNTPGRILQFDGHLDTVHLPFRGPRIEATRLYGSGAVDMKGGIAAVVEAMVVLRDGDLLPEGELLLTAHDLHECPWGDSRQLEWLIREGFVGDGVVIPEYLHDRLPVIGRGGLIWKVTFERSAPPIHEMYRGDLPNLGLLVAEFVQTLNARNLELGKRSHVMAGAESIFVGQIHSGELFNQDPATAWVEGTRRWLPGTTASFVQQEMSSLATEIASRHSVASHVEFHPMRDCFELNPEDELVTSFQTAHRAVSGNELPFGPKPFIDDGNTFSALAKIAAITHGPQGAGAHTTEEWVEITDLTRVATVYALTAIGFCSTALNDKKTH